jgi:hypothetical protein
VLRVRSQFSSERQNRTVFGVRKLISLAVSALERIRGQAQPTVTFNFYI